MNAQLDLAAVGLEEMDTDALMAVSGGLGGLTDLVIDIGKAAVKALVVCIATNIDSVVDGAEAGWAAAS